MKTGGLLKVGEVALGIVLVLACLPFVIGFGYAMVSLPIYGGVCEFKNVFSDKITPDGYRAFLLNRGCNLDEEIKRVVGDATDGRRAGDKFVEVYHGVPHALSGDEESLMHAVRAELRLFRPLKMSTDCGTGIYCPQSTFFGDDVISNLFASVWNKYALYAVPSFVFAVNMGADFLVGILRMGSVAQGFLFLLYAGASLVIIDVLGKLAFDFIKKLWRRISDYFVL